MWMSDAFILIASAMMLFTIETVAESFSSRSTVLRWFMSCPPSSADIATSWTAWSISSLEVWKYLWMTSRISLFRPIASWICLPVWYWMSSMTMMSIGLAITIVSTLSCSENGISVCFLMIFSGTSEMTFLG